VLDMDIEKTCEWIAASDVTAPTKKSNIDNLRRFALIPGFYDDPIGTLEQQYTNTNSLASRLRVLLKLHYNCPHFSLSEDALQYARLLNDKLHNDRVDAYERRERRETDVDWADVQAAEAKILPRDLLLFRCLTRLPPQRCADYSNMRVVDEDDGQGNVYDRSAQQFVFRHYKTAKKRGTKVVDVPSDIAELVPDQAYLFQSRQGGPVGYAAMSKRITALFKRGGLHAGAIALRRSFASQQVQDGVEGVDLARAAAAMDHHTRMHLYYAFKN
jgi:hypothetical protein